MEKPTIHIGQGTFTLVSIEKIPAHLDAVGKKMYKEIGNLLAKRSRLQETDLYNLEVYVVNYSQWVWACIEINNKNKEARGSGYIQVFPSLATNVSTEVVLRDKAADAMLKASKLFGLDPKSEKELKAVVANQTEIDFQDDFARNRLAK